VPFSIVADGVVFSFYALLQLGSPSVERMMSLSNRAAILSVSLSFFLLYVSFTADLTAIMTARPKSPGIESFDDVLLDNSLQVSKSTQAYKY